MSDTIDLVNLLRELAATKHDDLGIAADAAEEIVRLTATIAALQARVDEADLECQLLRASQEDVDAAIMKGVQDFANSALRQHACAEAAEAARAALEVENAGLRAALEDIAQMPVEDNEWDAVEKYGQARTKARAAVAALPAQEKDAARASTTGEK